ncbi:GGDEF domain-containing protein [Thiotrichales bacterium 19S9-12]|nr:GGDEF domain-containing protein [Thiotrichales bacterium 19S9-11]MCF6810789.1 GGDEF domain-containing protein [Thiotrichales bacterium 19S9-12]
MIEAFKWSKDFETHVDIVDEQHQRLVSLVNQVGELLSASRINKKKIQGLCVELVDYAHYHFEDEEALMKKHQLDQRHQKMHKKEHRKFFDYVSNIFDEKSYTDTKKVKTLLEFLMHWLVCHILGVDQSMAKQILAIEKKKLSSKEAYEKYALNSNGSTEPLVGALQKMFDHIIEQNKQLVILNKHLEVKVKERTKKLANANKRLKKIAYTDALTGLPNRRFAMETLIDFWNDCKGESLVCLMIDVDYFKKINDTFGHDIGDEYLKKLTKLLKLSLRRVDILCRLGGDEFFVICPETALKEGLIIAERLRKKVRETKINIADNHQWTNSLSIGVAEREKEMKTYDQLIKVADESLYLSKDSGRNTVKTIQKT